MRFDPGTRSALRRNLMQHQRNAINLIINSICYVLSRNILPASCPIIFEISIVVFADLSNSKNSSGIHNYYEYNVFKSADLHCCCDWVLL